MPGTGVAGAPLECVLLGANVLADLGARIENPATREVVAGWLPAAAASLSPPVDCWSVTFPVAPSAGNYLLVWRTQVDPPLVEIIDTVSITSPGGLMSWAPTVQDVADVAYEFTREAWTSDREYAGAEKGFFTDQTTPTAEHVERLIAAAASEVAGRVGATIPPRLHDLARRVAAQQAAAMVTAIMLPNSTPDASSSYQALIAGFLKGLDELASQARSGPVRLV